MFKNFTQLLLARLGRHLPRRLVQRDPMATGKTGRPLSANRRDGRA